MRIRYSADKFLNHIMCCWFFCPLNIIHIPILCGSVENHDIFFSRLFETVTNYLIRNEIIVAMPGGGRVGNVTAPRPSPPPLTGGLPSFLSSRARSRPALPTQRLPDIRHDIYRFHFLPHDAVNQSSQKS